MARLSLLLQSGRRALATAAAHPWLLWVGAGVALLLTTIWALNYTTTHLPKRGMEARVYKGQAFEGGAVLNATDHTLDPSELAKRARLDPSQAFSIEWEGYAVADITGRRSLRVVTDDGVAVWIDQTLIIDKLETPGLHDLSALVDLEEGLHPMRVRYVQFGGETRFRLGWSSPQARSEFQPLFVAPPTNPPLVFRRVAKALRFPRQVATAWSVWILAGLVIALHGLITWAAGRSLSSIAGWSSTWILALVALVLLSVGFDVGAFPWRGWAPDEITYRDSLLASREWFSGGWFFKYPPLQFYLLSLLSSPFLIGEYWQWFTFDRTVQELIQLTGRGLSVAMSLLTLAITLVIAEETIGRRRAVLATAFLLAVPVFVYYGKTANVDVPYLFWVSLAFLFFIRAAKYRMLADHAGLGIVVALAVSTKDQAYAFFPGVACVLLWLSWQENAAESSIYRRVARTASDRRLWAGATLCVSVYVLLLGVWWNYEGVAAHFKLIFTASQPYRMYPSNWQGLAQLAATTASMFPLAFGAVGTVFSAVGLGVALSNRSRFRDLLLLLVPVLSFAVTFLAVVGYVYDRFLLGATLVAALFAGLGLEWVTGFAERGRTRDWVAATVVILALTPSLLLDWRIVNDSRLQAERWMHTALREDPFVLGVGVHEYLPNLHPYHHFLEEPTSTDDVLRWNPDVVVLNEQWLDRPRRPTTAAMTNALRSHGYTESFALRPESSHFWLKRMLMWGTAIDTTFSNLSKINPPLSVWQREQH